MIDKWKLDENGEPIPAGDLMDWARWFEDSMNQRIVQQDYLGDIKVSTVFLSIDHSFGGDNPVLWESMIFGGPHDGYQKRCGGPRSAALELHQIALAVAKGERQPDPL